jgi:hypothetical protein
VVVAEAVQEKKVGQQSKITLLVKVRVVAEVGQVLYLGLYNFMVVAELVAQVIVQHHLLLILVAQVVVEMLHQVLANPEQLIQAVAVQAEVTTVVQAEQAAPVLLLFVGKVLV